MRIIIAFALTVSTVFAAIGYNVPDSVKVYFSINIGQFDPSFGDNAESMDSFIDKVRVAVAAEDLDSIVVYGFTSPDGPLTLNEPLAKKRCDAVAAYIMEQTGLGEDYIKIHPEGVAWDELRNLVADDSRVPERERILEILDNKSLHYYNKEGRYVDKRKEYLMSIDEGEPYLWMIDNLFPLLRYALAVSVYRSPDRNAPGERLSEDVTFTNGAIDSSEPDKDYEYPYEDISTPSEIGLYPDSEEVVPRHLFALKTNILYYGALLPNLELEWLFNDHWSVALEGNVASWGRYADKKSYRLTLIDTEVRRWIKPRKPWHGFFVGAFVGGGWYDLENGGNGYYGEGLITGLSVGYMWPISRNLSFEASAGVGYMYTRYKEYRPFEGHHLYLRTKDLNYFGPLRLKFSIVWRFLDKDKLRRSNRNI